MADVNVETVTSDKVTDAGTFLVYSVFLAIAQVISLIILVFIVTMILRKFGLGGVFKG